MKADWDHDEASLLLAPLEELTALLVAEESLETVLQRVVELACGTIGGCDLASVTCMNGIAAETIVYTDPVAEQIDQAQYATNVGPCLDAHRQRRVVSVPSIAEADSWEEFREAAMRHDVHSTLSLPLAAGDVHVGALNLYSRVDHAFESVAPESALLFASQAAAAVWSARTLERTRQVMEHLEAAMVTRDLIGMAKGIVMANEKVTPDAAFALLRTTSQNRNVKLRDVANEVVESGLTPAGNRPGDPA